MDFAVLVKAVPRSDPLAYDPRERRVVREGVELVVNSFDQRAVRVALELRRAGETVTAVSMGPPGAAAALRELRAVGVDRVLLLTDPEFAGSDTLATARALTAALVGVGHDVVLAGARTTDSDTGQVGPEVAELLGYPLASEARSVRRDATGPGFELVLDTAEGWSSGRLDAPFLVTVDEKITKPLRPGPEALAALPEGAVERVSRASLGIESDRVGVPGSPTVVGPVSLAAPARSPRVFREGSPADRARAAAEAIAPRIGEARPSPGGLPPAPVPPALDAEVPVLVTGAEGQLDPNALGLLAEVRRALPGHWPSAVWVGEPPTGVPGDRLYPAGALAGYWTPAALPPDPRTTVRAMECLLDARPEVAAVLFLSDPYGREVAGRLAARRSLGLVGDAVGMRPEPVPGVVWTKPSFGGRTVAEISCRTRPALATVRPGWFRPPPGPPRSGGFGWTRLDVSPESSGFRRLRTGREAEAVSDLEHRDVIVAVGMGVGGPDGVERVRHAVARWNAGLVATRRVVDAGWVPRQFQLGLTGRSLVPRLAVLLGVSGSANHMVGWKRAPAVLAVNPDPEAPVFRDVDVGVVGTVEELLPPLVEALAPLLGR